MRPGAEGTQDCESLPGIVLINGAGSASGQRVKKLLTILSNQRACCLLNNKDLGSAARLGLEQSADLRSESRSYVKGARLEGRGGGGGGGDGGALLAPSCKDKRQVHELALRGIRETCTTQGSDILNQLPHPWRDPRLSGLARGGAKANRGSPFRPIVEQCEMIIAMHRIRHIRKKPHELLKTFPKIRVLQVCLVEAELRNTRGGSGIRARFRTQQHSIMIILR